MTMTASASDDALLSTPSVMNTSTLLTLTRSACVYTPLATYALPRGEGKHYQQQYADMYFARLAQLKPSVEQIASEAFDALEISGEKARKVNRVLDVRQGNLCWVTGTLYMELPLKPNVLDDIGKEHWIAAPPAREKYNGVEGEYMLEDESGRLRLTGRFLKTCSLVTGVIVAVLGTENADGDFEVLDLRVPDLPRQPVRWEGEGGDVAAKKSLSRQNGASSGKVALVSGLSVTGDGGDTLILDLLAEWLSGEAAGRHDQSETARIARLIIAGNSLAHGQPIPSREDVIAAKKTGRRTYGYDAAAYNAAPTDRLDSYIASVLPSMPITLLPGGTDPTSTALPQPPIHSAMFPHSRAFAAPPHVYGAEPSWFDSVTNPFEFNLDGWRFLGGGGQTVDDVCRYVDGEQRIEMMEAMMRWRLTAPTAPDTLWCYPFQDDDRFVVKECPHVYFVGNQPKFETNVIEGPQGQTTRLIAVPSFRKTGQVVVVDLETLKTEVVQLEAFEA